MAKKKAKKKTKKTARKAAKKAVKKTAKKAAKKPVKKPAKKAAKKPAKKAKGPKLSEEKQLVGGTLLGIVEDYFVQVGVIAVHLLSGISVGDTIRIKGHTTDLTQRVESMQIDHMPVQAASPGDPVGIHVADRARKGDAVYKI